MADVALILASGGSRGLAHIGAIEVLEENGFRITSIAGASMGALVGGIYAAGGLDAFKEWMKSIDKMKMFSLMDFTLNKKGFVKGEKIIEELKALVPDKSIEELDIPFAAVATDIRHRREVIFEKGSLYEAIRSSISIPSLFTPNIIGNMLLIDGGVINPVPIDRVRRSEGDILAVVDLNGPYTEKDLHKESKDTDRELKNPSAKRVGGYIGNIRNRFDMFVVRHKTESVQEGERGDDMNMVSILDQSSSLMVQANADRTIALYPPDILVRIAKNAYSTLEFYKYEEIVSHGRVKMKDALKAAGMI